MLMACIITIIMASWLNLSVLLLSRGRQIDRLSMKWACLWWWGLDLMTSSAWRAEIFGGDTRVAFNIHSSEASELWLGWKQ